MVSDHHHRLIPQRGIQPGSRFAQTSGQILGAMHYALGGVKLGRDAQSNFERIRVAWAW